MFIEGQTFFETRGGGSIFIVLSKVSQDFKDWQAHFDELHGPGFVITADAPFRVTVAQGQEVYRGITNGAGQTRFLLGAGGDYDLIVADLGNNCLVVRQGKIEVSNGANIDFSNPVVRPGSGGLTVQDAGTVILRGEWNGAGVRVDNADLRLGGEFTLADVQAIDGEPGGIVIFGRLDLEGGALPIGQAWRVKGGILTNGRLEDASVFGDFSLVSLENMTVAAPLTLSSSVVILNDLILEADLRLDTNDGGKIEQVNGGIVNVIGG